MTGQLLDDSLKEGDSAWQKDPGDQLAHDNTMKFPPLGFAGTYDLESPGGKQFRVNGTFYEPSCAREANASEPAGDSLVGYDCSDVQPGAR